MKSRILLFGLIMAGFSSCATYRTGQTPDDVYYSPAREVNEYVQIERDEDRLSYNESNLEDRRLRQQIRDQRFRSFDEDNYWNSPRYNSWGWNTWNNPYNTWGWNNNYGMNYGWGWNKGYNNNYWGYNNYYNSNFICIPGGNNLIIVSGPGSPKNSTGIRYSSPIQRFVNSGTNYTNKGSGGSGSRYFNSNTNSNGTRRTGFFGGANTNSGNWNSGNNSNNRTFSNSDNSSSNGGSRTFSTPNNSGSSGSGSSGTKTTTSGRRN